MGTVEVEIVLTSLLPQLRTSAIKFRKMDFRQRVVVVMRLGITVVVVEVFIRATV
jgi:hypothetical protein